MLGSGEKDGFSELHSSSQKVADHMHMYQQFT
jgi:hypothetical protein